MLAQQPALTLDYRQQVEWLVRGTYPIAIAGNNRILPDFQKQGLGLNAKPLEGPGWTNWDAALIAAIGIASTLLTMLLLLHRRSPLKVGPDDPRSSGLF